MVVHEADEEAGRIVDDPADDLNDEEREELHRALDEAIASVKEGQCVDGDEVISRLLQRPSDQ